MTLDIGIGDGHSLWPIEGEPSLVLECDGYYWFLHPLLVELHQETGEYIDLFGEASFQAESLQGLERFLSSARALVASQPASWQVHVGTQVSPEHKELYRPVERELLIDLLDRFERVVARAKELGRPVVCFGD
jgi:hypothetical protein